MSEEGGDAPIEVKLSLAECRHKPHGLTSAETGAMIISQILLYWCLVLTFTLFWQRKVLRRARLYLNALPDRRIMTFVKKENRAPFELEDNPDLK
uniref:DUF3153 domain-containing protein n=1 Tax=Panagrellus redivivus TaxID=6233 RepID=A0A7E4V376_PANRE